MKTSNFTDAIGNYIWNLKYRHKSFNGENIDLRIEDTWDRIARTVSSIEIKKTYWHHQFYNALEDFKLIPAGRIISGAGTGRNTTLINTFLMGKIEDNLEDIFKSLTESAQTMRQGGGIGCDFSSIRPRGAEIKGVGKPSAGPLPFMDMWNQMCLAITEGGVNRGAMMATLNCDHPDIEEFIDAKKVNERLNKFNISVLITDEFMQAVQTNSQWHLKFNNIEFKAISAVYLWEKIMQATYHHSEPGVLFVDKMNKKNKLAYCENILGTNSCGEQPLPYYGSAPLASINLTKMIENPFTPDAKLNTALFIDLITIGVRFLDNTLTLSNYPLKKQKSESESKRRIGLGITGLADALAMCEIKYGSPEALNTVENWISVLQEASYAASAELAKKKGSFPLYDPTMFNENLQELGIPEKIIRKVKKMGIRNGTLNTIAPTGTSSLLAGNVSSGIEPIFKLSSRRKILIAPDHHEVVEIDDYAYKLYKKLKPEGKLPDYFITANELSPQEHLSMQSAAQKHIDASISKTINCPTETTYEDFKKIYADAYHLNCKGCTTYRMNDSRGSILM
jgi:ribonucleoside-diphosphate reductase alpha chain